MRTPPLVARHAFLRKLCGDLITDLKAIHADARSHCHKDSFKRGSLTHYRLQCAAYDSGGSATPPCMGCGYHPGIRIGEHYRHTVGGVYDKRCTCRAAHKRINTFEYRPVCIVVNKI